MIRSLFIAKTGMDAQQMQLDTITHNLANVGTVGYKRSHAVFEDLLYQNMRQAGAQSTQQTQLPTGLQLGVGVCQRFVATEQGLGTRGQIVKGKSGGHAGVDCRRCADFCAAQQMQQMVNWSGLLQSWWWCNILKK